MRKRIGLVSFLAVVLVGIASWRLLPRAAKHSVVSVQSSDTNTPLLLDAHEDESPPSHATTTEQRKSDANRKKKSDPLAEAFVTDDDAKKIDAVEDAVRDGVVTALPKLAAIDLKSEPEAAPTIIHGVANLAAQGDREDRHLAVRTLSRWLRDESDRLDTHLDRDAAGNVPNIIDALGEVGGRDAIDTLITALDTGKLDLSVQTLTVQKLSELGDPRATASIERFAERVASTRPAASDDFERELHDEATAEARTAIARLETR